MIVLGIILLLIGYFTSLSILYTIGGILVVVGVILWILGAVGRPVGGRKVWFCVPHQGLPAVSSLLRRATGSSD